MVISTEMKNKVIKIILLVTIIKAWGNSSVLECLLNIREALDLISSTTHAKMPLSKYSVCACCCI